MIEEKNISLNQLVQQVVTGVLPLAQRQLSQVEAIIQPDILVRVDQKLFTTLLSDLISTVLLNTQKDCLRVLAKSYNSITVIHLRNNDTRHEDLIRKQLTPFEEGVNKLGGCLSVTKSDLYGAGISFTFLNQLAGDD